MQRLAMLFLILILTALPVLSIATSVIFANSNTTPICQQPAEMQASHFASEHDCCQMQGNHCVNGQCDCDTGHFSSSLTSNLLTLPLYCQQPVFQQCLLLGFISHRSNSLYRPPRIIL